MGVLYEYVGGLLNTAFFLHKLLVWGGNFFEHVPTPSRQMSSWFIGKLQAFQMIVEMKDFRARIGLEMFICIISEVFSLYITTTNHT